MATNVFTGEKKRLLKVLLEWMEGDEEVGNVGSEY
jgi:hypothetical protein